MAGLMDDLVRGSQSRFVKEQEMKLEVVEGETPAKQCDPCHA